MKGLALFFFGVQVGPWRWRREHKMGRNELCKWDRLLNFIFVEILKTFVQNEEDSDWDLEWRDYDSRIWLFRVSDDFEPLIEALDENGSFVDCFDHVVNVIDAHVGSDALQVNVIAGLE